MPNNTMAEISYPQLKKPAQRALQAKACTKSSKNAQQLIGFWTGFLAARNNVFFRMFQKRAFLAFP
jgi:hypothetical protein